MTTGNEYFTPLYNFFYLATLFVAMVVFYQWSWANKCRDYVKVLVVKADGDTNTEYAPKQGGIVALKNPHDNTIRMWPINKMCAIEMLYPGDGFVPVFLQKKIKTVIVDVEDWEPLLNRGSYSEKVASPDVVKALRSIAVLHPEAAEDIEALTNVLSTAPTREMVASPAVFGNVMGEKVSEMAVTVGKDTLDKLGGIVAKLEKLPTSTILYLGLGLILVVLIYLGFQIIPALKGGDASSLANLISDVQKIKLALGVK